MFLSIVGAIQPEVAVKVFRDGDADGMTARFGLVAYPTLPEAVEVVDRQPDYKARGAVEQRLRDMRAATAQRDDRGEIEPLRLAGEAYAVFNRWLLNNENRPEKRDGSAFGAHLAKYPGLFARLCLVFHFMDGRGDLLGQPVPLLARDKIKGETAEAVRQFSDEYLEPHARRLYGTLRPKPAQRR
jgi:Protein of unknown function (DUF3987)